MRIVGLCGFARSGKDSVARALTERGWARGAFADALKNDVLSAVENSLTRVAARAAAWDEGRFSAECNYADDRNQEVFEAVFGDGDKAAVRPLLVEYGRYLRHIDPGHWIRRAEVEVSEIERAIRDGSDPDTKGVVITDVRYADEAKWIRERGGIVVLVQRQATGPANAEEEGSLAQFSPDFIITNNDGFLEHARKSLLEIVEPWPGK